MKKLFSVGLTGLGLVFLMWLAFSVQQHFKRQSEIKAKLEEAIGRDAGYTETILKMEKDSENITFEEFFQLCDKSIEQRTNLIVELRGLYPAVNDSTKDKLIDFLNAENDTIRAKRDLYRRWMLMKSAAEGAAVAVKSKPSSEYGWDFYRDSLRRARDEMEEAAKNLQSSGQAFMASYQRTLAVESEVTRATARSAIRFHPIFKQYDQSNMDKGKEVVTGASSLLEKT